MRKREKLVKIWVEMRTNVLKEGKWVSEREAVFTLPLQGSFKKIKELKGKITRFVVICAIE